MPRVRESVLHDPTDGAYQGHRRGAGGAPGGTGSRDTQTIAHTPVSGCPSWGSWSPFLRLEVVRLDIVDHPDRLRQLAPGDVVGHDRAHCQIDLLAARLLDDALAAAVLCDGGIRNVPGEARVAVVGRAGAP